MGCVHRFQMRTASSVVSVCTPPERAGRIGIIEVEDDGPPEPTVPGFVVAGESNAGRFPNRGDRCPLSELRLVDLSRGGVVGGSVAPANEHWAPVTGGILLSVDGERVELHPGDGAVIRAGVARGISAVATASVALARE